MVSMETAQAWAEGIQADARMTGWIAEAEKAYELRISPTTEEGWFSEVVNGKAKIGMGETERPLPSFAHEILHVCLSARGYKHVVELANTDPIRLSVLQALISSLDNELQHHRMFGEFVATGFDGGEFYHDGDAAGHADVRKDIEALTKNHPPVAALFVYLTLLAPGGNWPDGAREELTHLLQANVSMDTWDKLQVISGIIGRCKQQADLDPTETVAAIIEALDDFDGTFVGEPNAYPVGAFVPKGLTQEAFEAHAKAVFEANNA